MQISFDSGESLNEVLRVVSAAYGVNIGVTNGQVPASRPASGRKAAGRKASRPAAKSQPRKTSAAAKADSSDIRDWARKQGHAVSDRGRLPASVVEAYRAAGL